MLGELLYRTYAWSIQLLSTSLHSSSHFSGENVDFLDWKTGSYLSSWRFASEFSRVRMVRISEDGRTLYTATVNPYIDSMGPAIPPGSNGQDSPSKSIWVYNEEISL